VSEDPGHGLRVREPRRLVRRDAARRGHRARDLAGRGGEAASTLLLTGARRRDLRGRPRRRGGPRRDAALERADDRLPARVHQLAAIAQGRGPRRLPEGCVTGLGYEVPELHHRPARASKPSCKAARGIAPRPDARRAARSAASTRRRRGSASAAARPSSTPAVHPHRHFQRYLGPQKNLYTGEEFVLTEEHVDELRALEVERITKPGRYWVFPRDGRRGARLSRRGRVLRRRAAHGRARAATTRSSRFPEHVPDSSTGALNA
jgi:hypothetical protein